MMTKLYFKGKIYEYNEEIMSIESLNEITHDDAKEILFLTQDILSECNIKMHLSYGTLLGAVRDKDFIKGDLDVDVAIDNEDRLFDSLKYLHERGLVLVRARIGCVYSFRINEKCYIDIYIKRPLRHSIWSLYCCSLAGTVVPKKYFKGEDTLTFLGRQFVCVKNPERLLEFWYGKSWVQPIGKFEQEYIYEVKSHYYFSKYLITLKKRIRRLLGDKIYDGVKNCF